MSGHGSAFPITGKVSASDVSVGLLGTLVLSTCDLRSSAPGGAVVTVEECHRGESRGSRLKNVCKARARVHAERVRRLRAARLRRQLKVSAAVFGGAGLLAAVIITATGGGRDADAAVDTAMQGPLIVPVNASDTDGTVIVYGDPATKRALDVYEDPRCPFCGIVERRLGSTMQQLADEGTYKIRYHIATFLDDNFGGSGSKMALGALGAALNQGTAQFAALHAELYNDQPEETKDSFADPEKLLSLAAKTPGLNQAAIRDAVNGGTFLPWTAKVSRAASENLDEAWKQAGLGGPSGTPAVFIDGRPLSVIKSPQDTISVAEFKKLVAANT